MIIRCVFYSDKGKCYTMPKGSICYTSNSIDDALVLSGTKEGLLACAQDLNNAGDAGFANYDDWKPYRVSIQAGAEIQ